MKTAILGMVLAVALSGCNTVAGVGADVTDGAHKVQSWF
ncbi:entericidin [Rhodobacter capsulatus]|jgi:predicted small secreted protein|uniref:Entericidin B n=1 Tax=Rhodobacter capsulatus (strain ATCC BAA-309 / NBRC 16581 / SB1003) TaxID=272942 RepID=D5AUC1_RHOCB|nr:entericidin [Rhodobacter capsulatus]ADE85560.1 entericidin B [Rhodobacter capsulatus SB 1003]ETD01593.1 entericidin [Rhodobacter capsulatus DE442]ETD76660.1 entericidin [Rhodobacter capsulatus R121]ETD81244.1 entericidin [Rhodobacter capsulatus B6]ETD84483.1 entericidin [Rhodobacter capsulatus YW1]